MRAKYITILAVAAPLVFVVLILGTCVAGIRRHDQRVDRAIEQMESFGDEHWERLFRESTNLYTVVAPRDTAIPIEVWPPIIQDLNPYHVWLRGTNEIFMVWTGGFHERHLSARVHRQKFRDHLGEIVEPGVIVWSPSAHIPEQPYTHDTKGNEITTP